MQSGGVNCSMRNVVNAVHFIIQPFLTSINHYTMAKKKQQKTQESKKSAQKKKDQLIVDKTFGLKNKNKSKKVQQKINSIERSVNNVDPKMRKLEEQRKRAKAENKARKKAMEDERNALFGEALLAVQKKGKNTSHKEGKQEAKGRDADDEAKKPSQSRAMKMMFQMDAKEMEERLKEDPNYVPTLEDEIESQRQKKVEELKKSGKGTPVTPETFKAWQEKKRRRKAEEAKSLVEAEFKKKKGGKGLAVLSGRALFDYKKELFVDDEGAAEDIEKDFANDETENTKVDELPEIVEEKLSVDQGLFDADVELPDDF